MNIPSMNRVLMMKDEYTFSLFLNKEGEFHAKMTDRGMRSFHGYSKDADEAIRRAINKAKRFKKTGGMA